MIYAGSVCECMHACEKAFGAITSHVKKAGQGKCPHFHWNHPNDHNSIVSVALNTAADYGAADDKVA